MLLKTISCKKVLGRVGYYRPISSRYLCLMDLLRHILFPRLRFVKYPSSTTFGEPFIPTTVSAISKSLYMSTLGHGLQSLYISPIYGFCCIA